MYLSHFHKAKDTQWVFRGLFAGVSLDMAPGFREEFSDRGDKKVSMKIMSEREVWQKRSVIIIFTKSFRLVIVFFKKSLYVFFFSQKSACPFCRPAQHTLQKNIPPPSWHIQAKYLDGFLPGVKNTSVEISGGIPRQTWSSMVVFQLQQKFSSYYCALVIGPVRSHLARMLWLYHSGK